MTNKIFLRSVPSFGNSPKDGIIGKNADYISISSISAVYLKLAFVDHDLKNEIYFREILNDQCKYEICKEGGGPGKKKYKFLTPSKSKT